jgi:hypothetical protein
LFGELGVISRQSNAILRFYPGLTVVIRVQFCGSQHYVDLLSVIGSACMKKRALPSTNYLELMP